MVTFVGEPRYDDDDRTLALLRRLATGLLTTDDVVSALFEQAMTSTGPITADALHIAAEATTDHDLDLARSLLLALLWRVGGSNVTASAGVTIVGNRWAANDRAETVTPVIQVPAVAVP